MDSDSHQGKPQTESRAEQLLALRQPLIERGMKVPALERSIAAHEVEANALFALLCSANTGQRILLQERDEARLEIDIVRLETDLVRARLRTAEKQLADARDLAHLKHDAHVEEVSTLKKRCSAMRRRIDYLSVTQKRELETKIAYLENSNEEYRNELLEINHERDEWRETSISLERDVKDLKAKNAQMHAIPPLLETERTLSAALRKELIQTQQAVENANQENLKLTANEAAKRKAENALTKAENALAKAENALQAEKEKTSTLLQKLKDADSTAKKLKREESKLRQKCDGLEKRLEEALARAVQSEERAADLANRPTTRSRAVASPRQDALISPAPLTFGRRPAEDMASESRSRFTANLPRGIRDDGSSDDDESEESDESSPPRRKQKVSPRTTRKKAKSQKPKPPRKTIAKRAPRRRVNPNSESLKGPESKKRRQPASESSGPKGPRFSATNSPAPVTRSSPRTVTPKAATPRRKHGKATRKTTVSSPARRLRESTREARLLNESPRRMLRARRPVNYNYDDEEGSAVEEEHSLEVDYESLQPLRVTRSAKSQRPEFVTDLELSDHALRSRTVSPATAKRPRRMETVRKQVPTTRSGVK